MPIASRLPKYKSGSSRTPDLIAAISVATLLIPESISYATVADWRAATRRGEDTIMPAIRRSDVAALNDHTRSILVAERVVDDDPIHVRGQPYAPGDRILTLHNDYRRGLNNGQRGTIVSSELEGFRVLLDGEDRPRLVPDAYFEACHVDHAYAMTVHKAQGLTCDRAYVLGPDDLYVEAGHTALSHGRHENRLYITVHDELEVDHHRGPEVDDPIEGTRAALHRSERPELASRQLAGLSPARTALLAPVDRSEPDAITQGSPERRRHRPRLVSVRSDVTRGGVRVARGDHDDQGGQWRLPLDRGQLAYRLRSGTSRKLRGSPRQWRARR